MAVSCSSVNGTRTPPSKGKALDRTSEQQRQRQGEAVKTSYRRSAPPAWQRGREGPLRSDAMRFKLRVINRETLSSAHLVSRQTDTAVIR